MSVTRNTSTKINFYRHSQEMKYCDEIRLTLFRELEICAQNIIQNNKCNKLEHKAAH